MSTSENNLKKHKYLIAISHFSKFGPRSIRKIKASFKDIKDAFYASEQKLESIGIPEKIAKEFVLKRNEINPDKILEILQKENIDFISSDDKNFPALLKETIIHIKHLKNRKNTGQEHPLRHEN